MGFFDFLKKPKKTATDVAKGGLRFLEDTFLPGQSLYHNIQDKTRKDISNIQRTPAYRDNEEYRRRVDALGETVNGPSPIEKTRDLAVTAARAIPRGGATIAASVADPLVKGDQSSIQVQNNPQNPSIRDKLVAAVYGKEPIETHQKRFKGNEKVAQGSRFRSIATPLALVGAGINVFGDLTPIGGAKKGAGEEIVKQLVKESSEEGIKAILKGKVAPEIIKNFKGALAKADDVNVTRNILVKAGVDPATLVKTNKVAGNITKPGEDVKVFTGHQGKGSAFSTPDKQFATDRFANEDEAGNIVKGIVTPKTLKGPDILDVRIPEHRTKLESVLGKDNVDNMINRSDIGLPHHAAEGDQDALIDAANQLGYKHIALSDTNKTNKFNGRDVIAYADTTKAPSIVSTVGKEISNSVPPTIPGAKQVAEVNAANPFDDITQAITGKPAGKGQSPQKGIAALQKEQAELLSKERGQRFAAGAKNSEGVEGSEAYFKRKAALSGEYSKVDYHPMLGDIGPERSEELFTAAQKKIYSTPDDVYTNMKLHPGGARLRTETAVRKVLGMEPGLPTASELKLLSVYDPRIAKAVKEQIPKDRQLFDYASDVAGSSRALKSGADLSMGGRQGLFVAARHPLQWAEANKKSIKFAKDEDYYFKRMKELSDDPWIKAGEGHEIGLQGAHGLKEEAFTNPALADKVPGIRRSERAYTGGLSELRGSLWKNALQRYGKTPEEAAAKLGDKGLEGLAEAVRTLTGRGGKTGGSISKRANTLGEALFSPRLWASRLQPFNPRYWARIGPAGRKEAFESLGSFAAVAGLALGAAVAAGADVETDPRSSDFLKIKVGDTRYDILGGFQQNLVFGWRQLTGEKKNSQTGKVTTFARDIGDVIAGRKKEDVVDKGPYTGNRLTAAADLLGNKAAPIPAAALRLIAGQDKAGNDINPLTEIGQLFVPISVQGAYHGFQREGVKGAAKNIPDFFGFGSQTYGVSDIKIPEKQKEYIDNLKSKGASPDEVKATTQFFQTLKTAPDIDSARGKIQEAMLAGDKDKVTQLAKDYNKGYSSTFKKWADQYGKQYGSKDLTELYNKGKITSDDLSRLKNKLKKEREDAAKGIVRL